MPVIALRSKIRFDRNELSGAFGDIGTDLPLIVGLVLTCGLSPASTLTLFGSLQILTGLLYRMPMPVQPLKAVAVIMITQRLSPAVLYGGGLAIALCMLALSLTGALSFLARAIPKAVVRGIQFGLGLQLCLLAMKDYLPAEAAAGYFLATGCFVVGFILLGNRRLPPAIPVIGIGIAYAFTHKLDVVDFGRSFEFHAPSLYVPALDDVLQGLVLLALPQVPLSIANSVLATTQSIRDFFPERRITPRRIGLTYAMMNLISPFFAGIPVCHGSGGLAGHYGFGARTGGSVILYGSLYVTLGLFFSNGFRTLVNIFPLPVLAVCLLFEGMALVWLMSDLVRPAGAAAGGVATGDSRQMKWTDSFVAILVGLISAGIPNGYAVGLAVGWILCAARNRIEAGKRT